MKYFRTLPSNTEFFNRYAGLIPTLKIGGYLAQIVSYATEIGVLYAIIRSTTSDFLPIDTAHKTAIAGALLVALFLEVTLRKLLPYAARAILYKRTAGPDALMSAFILTAAGLLLFASGYLSFAGSKDLVEYTTPPPPPPSTLQIDTMAAGRRAATLANWAKDSATIAASHAAQIAAHQTSLRQLRRSPANAGARRELTKAIAKAKADQATQTARAWSQTRAQLDAIEAGHQNERNELKEEAAQQKEATAAKINRYGSGLGYFTLVCLIVLIIAVFLTEVYEQGAGIETIYHPTQYDFAPGVLVEAFEAATERINQTARARIYAFADATPPPPLPAQMQPLYDPRGLSSPVITLMPTHNKGQAIEIGVKHYPTPTPGNNGLSMAHNGQSTAHERTANGLSMAHNGQNKAANGLSTAANGQTATHNGQNTAHNGTGATAGHYPPEGPQYTEEGPQNGQNGLKIDLTERVISIGTAICANCSTIYPRRHVSQKYCSDNCKLDAHAQRHGGTKFDPIKYHYGTPSKKPKGKRGRPRKADNNGQGAH